MSWPSSLYPNTSAGMRQSKQLTRYGYSSSTRKQAALRAPERTATVGHGPAYRGPRTQHDTPGHRHWRENPQCLTSKDHGTCSTHHGAVTSPRTPWALTPPSKKSTLPLGPILPRNRQTPAARKLQPSSLWIKPIH